MLELLGLADLSKTWIFYIYKLIKIDVIGYNKDLVFKII